MVELIHDKGVPGRRGASLPRPTDSQRYVVSTSIPQSLRRQQSAPLPEVSELDAVRHFTRLSQKNYSIDGQFYPLGSCTMKYNPKVNDQLASLPGFADLHPFQDASDCQGTLGVMFELQESLKEILGMSAVSLAPAAGAQGEYAGMTMIRAYHRSRGDEDRRVVLVPDSAHGTNPASAALAGFSVRTIKSTENGRIDLDSLKENLDDTVAGIMLTNPNTCGVFETDIREIADLVHGAGGLLYYDGANLNAIVGLIRPGDMGFDVVHVNLHKTFSTPHGGGGPGSGAVGVGDKLVPFLPTPHVVRNGDLGFQLAEGDEAGSLSIGDLMAFHGNTGVLIRALAYIKAHGGAGLRSVAEAAVLNANYVLRQLPEVFEKPFAGPCKHEALISVRKAMKDSGIKAYDVAKRLLDLGFHAPTVYFPLLIAECLLIEPTETESKQTLDDFLAAMNQIAQEIETDPMRLTEAPQELDYRRLDDAKAARQLNVCCDFSDDSCMTRE